MKRMILSVVALFLLASTPLQAQEAVVLVGDIGVTAALEVPVAAGFRVRGGVINHTDTSNLGWIGSLGYRWEGKRPFTLDLAYDAEKMPALLEQTEGDVDSRVRIGLGFRVIPKATFVTELSRSLVNGTGYDRIVAGIRFRW